MTVANKILLVEDMVTQAIRLQQLLKAGGVSTISLARSGQDALKVLAAETEWDAIISDINMPEMDGFELCRQIKQADSLKAIPFILLVSLKDPRDAVKSMECGADNILVKEYEKEYFMSQLAAVLENAAENQSPTPSTRVFVNGQWHEINLSANQLAAYAFSAYAMAMREKAARLREPAGTHT